MTRAKTTIASLLLVLLCFASFNLLLRVSYPRTSTQGVATPTFRLAKATPTSRFVDLSPGSTPMTDNVTEEDIAYVLTVLAIVPGYADALNAIGAKFTQLESQPSLILDEVWKQEATSAFTAILYLSRQLREINPPPRMTNAHTKLLEGARHYDLAVTYASSSIDNLDMDTLALAATELRRGTDSMSEGNALIVEMEASLR